MGRIAAEVAHALKDWIVWSSLLFLGLSLWIAWIDVLVWVREHRLGYLGRALSRTGMSVIVGLIGYIVYRVGLQEVTWRTWVYVAALLMYSIGTALTLIDLSQEERRQAGRPAA